MIVLLLVILTSRQLKKINDYQKNNLNSLLIQTVQAKVLHAIIYLRFFVQKLIKCCS